MVLTIFWPKYISSIDVILTTYLLFVTIFKGANWKKMLMYSKVIFPERQESSKFFMIYIVDFPKTFTLYWIIGHQFGYVTGSLDVFSTLVSCLGM